MYWGKWTGRNLGGRVLVGVGIGFGFGIFDLELDFSFHTIFCPHAVPFVTLFAFLF